MFTVEKQHLRLEIPSIIFLWMMQSISLSNCQVPQETGKIVVSGHLHSSELHCAIISVFTSVFSLSMQIQPTGFYFFCLSLVFSVGLLKYFWCCWHCDLPPRCCTFSGATILMLLPPPLCMLCLSVESSRSPRARGGNLS